MYVYKYVCGYSSRRDTETLLVAYVDAPDVRVLGGESERGTRDKTTQGARLWLVVPPFRYFISNLRGKP